MSKMGKDKQIVVELSYKFRFYACEFVRIMTNNNIKFQGC